MKVLSYYLFLTYILISSHGTAQQPIAVLVVGHAECHTRAFIEEANRTARFLQEKGFRIYKFYDEDAYWNDIKSVAKDASIFLYSGHGTFRFSGYGGLAIRELISPDQIMDELVFNKNPLILMSHVCGASGSSALDVGDIGFNESKKRAQDTYFPFYKSGASAYISNNYVGGILNNLKRLFEGKALHDCFQDNKRGCDFYFDSQAEGINSIDSIRIFSNQKRAYETKITNNNTITYMMIHNYPIASIGKSNFRIFDILPEEFSYTKEK